MLDDEEKRRNRDHFRNVLFHHERSMKGYTSGNDSREVLAFARATPVLLTQDVVCRRKSGGSEGGFKIARFALEQDATRLRGREWSNSRFA